VFVPSCRNAGKKIRNEKGIVIGVHQAKKGNRAKMDEKEGKGGR